MQAIIFLLLAVICFGLTIFGHTENIPLETLLKFAGLGILSLLAGVYYLYRPIRRPWREKTGPFGID